MLIHLVKRVASIITSEEFFQVLLMCESLFDGYHDHEIVTGVRGGDFNADLSRDTANTRQLFDFCQRYGLIFVDFDTAADTRLHI